MRQADLSLVLPAFNEAATIARTIGEVTSYFAARDWRYEVIVAADGDDGTRERAAEMALTNSSIRVVGEKTRRGKGRGIREGVAIASGRIIGFADADNKVPVTEYAKLEPWLASGYDLVIGSRGLRESKIEQPQRWYRRAGSKGFSVFMHAMVGLQDIPDTQCGFKFFRHDVAHDLFQRQQVDGYMFDVEVLALARRAGYRIKQVPILWRDDADSRLQLFRGNIRNGIDILKISAALGRQSGVRLAPALDPDRVAAVAKLSPAGSVIKPGIAGQ